MTALTAFILENLKSRNLNNLILQIIFYSVAFIACIKDCTLNFTP